MKPQIQNHKLQREFMRNENDIKAHKNNYKIRKKIMK
jgi:hypothetical protein